MVSVGPEWYSIAMSSDSDPDLHLRGRLVRSLGQLREMLPGSFVERKRSCGRPNCHCADGKNLHTQYQISVLVDGQVKTFNVPAALVEQVRQKIELRRRFEAAAAAIFKIKLRRYFKQKEKPLPCAETRSRPISI